MKASARVFTLAALLMWVICVVWPSAAIVLTTSGAAESPVQVKPMTTLLFTSLSWGAVVALLSMLVGWAPGRLLGSAITRRGFIPLAALALVPLCMPAYIVYFAWWQSWPVDSSIHQWAIEHGMMQRAREATLLIGLVCWSWPLVSLCVAGAAAARPVERDDMLQLDHAGLLQRIADRVRTDGRGLALGGFLVFLATLNNTTCFDLAEVFTFANEIRAMNVFGGAGVRQILVAGAPMMTISVIGGLLVWRLLQGSAQTSVRTHRASIAIKTISILVWLTTVALPLALFLRHTARTVDLADVMTEFVLIYRWSVVNTVSMALVSGIAAGVLASGAFFAWNSNGRFMRWLMTAAAISWLCFALCPGTIVGAAIEAAYNLPSFAFVFDHRGILLVGHLASFGFVALLLARWSAASTPKPVRDLQRIDGVRSFRMFVQANRPNLLASGLAALSLMFVLAIGEIPVTAMINPPLGAGSGPLAMSLLNDMHYQRPQTVMIAALGINIVAIVTALTIALVWRLLRTMVTEGNPQWVQS